MKNYEINGCEGAHSYANYAAPFLPHSLVIRVVNNKDRTSAIGLARYSREYFDAAMAADDVIGIRPGYEISAPDPVMFLVAHSIELAIKSYLIHKGYTLGQIRCLSHNLSDCWQEAVENGVEGQVTLTDEDMGVLKLISNLHASTELRYIKTGIKELPAFAPLQTLAEKILDGICPYVGYK